MAGVTPTIFGFFSASSTSVSPNTVWYRGGRLLVSVVMRSPVSGSNLPGACLDAWVFFGRFEAFAFYGVQMKYFMAFQVLDVP